MALGTYDREERKKLAYNANGTTSEEKDDRSAQGVAAPVQGTVVDEETPMKKKSVRKMSEVQPPITKVFTTDTTPMQPTQVAPAPQVQNVGTVNVPQVNASAQPKQEQSNDELTQQNVGATPPQKVVTNQGPQSNVIPGGEIKNNQGEVNQETGTSSESQVGPESSAGGENYQWAGAPQGDVTSTYNGLIGPQNATPPLNAPVRDFGGYNFSTVTPSGKALTDSDMDAYFDLLKRKSEETGASVEDLDKIAGNLLVGKAPSAEQSNQEDAPAVESVQENGNNTTNNGAATTTTDNGASSTSGTSSGKPKVTVMPPAAKPAASGTSAPTSEEQQYYDNWKDFSLEQLKDMLPANSGIPAKKAALERLISEKGGSGTTPAQGTAAGTTSTPKYTKRQQARRDAAATEMTNKDVYNGNVDLLKRPSVDAATMHAAGYTEIPDGSYASVYSMQNGFRDKSKKGKVREILYTPIMADGTVLSQKEVDDYLAGLGKKGDILELDKPENGGKGLVIAADVKDDLGPHLHELQETYYSTPDDYAAKGKDAEARMTSLGGNQNPLTQKPVTKKDMVDAGWAIFSQYPDDDIYAYPIQQVIADADGKEHKVIMTPITKDGDILSPEQFDSYVSSLQNNSNIKDADGKDRGLILKYDAEDGDAEDINDDINTWRVAQPEKDETQGRPLGDLYQDDTERKLVDEIERAQKNTEEFYNKYLGPNASWMEAASKANQDKLKEEGLDEESEKRLEKRRKTAGIIANIGDILQGFANLAGAWYGAKSSDLTSLSASAQAGNEKVDAKRQKRKDELQENYDKTKKKNEDYYMKMYLEMKKANERLENQLFGYRVSRGKTEQRYQLSEEKAQRDAERKRQEQERKHQQDVDRDERRAKQREDLAKLNSVLRRGDNDHATSNKIKVKQTAGASSKKGKNKTGGGSKPASRR